MSGPADSALQDGAPRLTDVLVEFARTLSSDLSVEELLQHLVLRVVDVLPVTGAAVTLLDGGPGLHAHRGGDEVGAVLDAVAGDACSPRFVDPGAGVALSSFPLRSGHHRLGSLDLHGDGARPMTAGDRHAAQVLADVAAAHLAHTRSRLDTAAAAGRLERRTLHDPLTGLPNRTLLAELLERAVARAQRSPHTVAVMFADLDGFRAVEEHAGQDVADALLCALADRLTQVLRPTDTLARIAGDQFVVLCEELDGAAAETVAERVREASAEPFALGGRVVQVSLDVSLVFAGRGDELPRSLLREADLASLNDDHPVLDRTLRVVADRSDDLDADLQLAQRRGELTLAYQPIVAVASGEVVAVEALLRWDHPWRGVVMPAEVLQGAGRVGLLPALGSWVLRQACHDLRRWRHDGLAVPVVTVNLAAGQLYSPGWVRAVAAVLADTGTEPSAVRLELTEATLLEDASRSLSVLEQLHRSGVGLALDDFGVGYSSLSCLRRFPFDVLKLDRCLTAGADDAVTRAIVSSVVDLSHVLDLTVTAEGVQTADELRAVADLGVDHVQGFHVGRPVSVAELHGQVLAGSRGGAA